MMPLAEPRSLLDLVPQMELSFDGDCAQANGIDLPIAAINLAYRPDRWEALSTRMAAVGLDKLIKVPAVEGAKLPEGLLAELLGSRASDIATAPRGHLTLTRPAIGCSLSHLGIWRWIVRHNVPRVLVLEDDARPAAQFDAARLRRSLATIPEKAGLVFLGQLIMGGLADRPEEGQAWAQLYYFNGTFAYLITPVAAKRLLNEILPLRAHIDHQLSQIMLEQRHDFPAYYAAPTFFEPDWSLGSDCFVALADDATADRELDCIIDTSRDVLLGEGRPLLPKIS